MRVQLVSSSDLFNFQQQINNELRSIEGMNRFVVEVKLSTTSHEIIGATVYTAMIIYKEKDK